MNAKERRKEKRAAVRHNPKPVGRPAKIGVEKGFGPRHASNSKEGEDLTKVNSDVVPAMLTPREAVLNRNAAELAGRGNIEALNAQGNKLAGQGVDLATASELAGGGTKMKKQKLAEGGNVKKQPGYLGPPEQMPGFGGERPPPQGGMGAILSGRPNFTANQWYNPAQGAWQARRPQEQPFAGGGPQPMPLPMPMPVEGPGGIGGAGPMGTPAGPYPGMAGPMGGGFYPPNQGPFKKPLGMQAGSTEVQPIGTPAQGQVYGPPIQLSAPDILTKLQAAGKEQGLSSAQINGLMNAFKGAGQAFSGGSGLSNYGGTGNMDAVGAFSGGISDIGYPPFVAPNADYHGDKGGWQGRYDPNYFIPNYG